MDKHEQVQPDTNLVLIIEDSEFDFDAIKRAFKKADPHLPIHHCTNAESAIEYIRSSGIDKNILKPTLIILDLNLPGMGGLEFLKYMKEDAETKSLPIVVFTSSNAAEDIVECYTQGANSYVVKPLDAEKLYHTVKMIKEYWFQVSKISS